MFKKAGGGFTLLELLVVVIIIAVLAGVLVPAISVTARQADYAVERLHLLINMAQQEAVMTSRIWQLELDSGNGEYRFREMEGMEFRDTRTSPLAGIHRLEQVHFESIRINGRAPGENRGQVYLFPTGEQDSLEIIMRADGTEYRIAMGPVGPAGLEEL